MEIRLDEAEELLIEAAREGMSQPMHFGETLGREDGEAGWLMPLTKLQKTDLDNTTAVFRDKPNSWHGPKFHSAYAMSIKHVYNVRDASLNHSFIHFLEHVGKYCCSL